MKIWGLYSSVVDYGCPNELIELFADEAQARFARDALIGKPMYSHSWQGSRVWQDDDEPEFSNLYVVEMNLR